MAVAPSAGRSADDGTVAGWVAFADRLRDLAAWIDNRPAAQADPGARARGTRYLGRMAIAALHHEVEFADPAFPHLYRCIDAVSNWGGPNVDNEYLAAPVDARHTYVLRGDTTRSPGFILELIRGIWHRPEGFAILADRTSREFTPEPDGSIAITLGGPALPGNWMEIPPDADRLWIRQYGIDWARDETCGFTLERLDTADTPLVPDEPTPQDMALRLDRATAWLDGAVRYWVGYMESRDHVRNQLPVPMPQPGGGHQIRYGVGVVELPDDEALLVELEPPDADYWSVQLYDLPWFESLDYRDRITSLNQEQVTVDEDGRVRLVVASADPGTPNWLDTGGQRTAMLIYRCVWCRSVSPPASRVIPLSGVADAQPGGRLLSAAERRGQLAARRREAARWTHS